MRDKPVEEERLRMYRRSLLALWLATAAAFAAGGTWQPTEVVSSTGDWVVRHRGWIDAAVMLVCGAFLFIFAQGVWHGSSAARRKAIEPAFDRLVFLLPVTRRERRWWVALSLTAGICEEMLYRGYLLHLLDERTGLAGAWLLSSLAFGFAHLYQGWKGIASATATGLLFGLLAIGTGGLVLPIVVHVLVDLQMLWMYRPGTPGNSSE
ncbi:CPBP family intramembrane glutamic endopeptidase [Massilia sp. METH4]|uniref:CPBP family intramembrane glutamic endopeptidase n=1 Tax=Massilia sp. METH4 TaxID=3123041 RepID=UPI0030D3D4ED